MIKSTTNHRLLLMAAIMLAGVLATSSAKADITSRARVEIFSGTISEKLKVTGCGQDKNVSLAGTVLSSNKGWTTATDNGTFEGKYRTKSRGRKLYLNFDSNSKALFMRNMKDWASDICETAVKKLKNFKYSIKLKLNKKHTVLKGTIKGTAIGSTRDGSGKGTYTGKVKMFTPD